MRALAALRTEKAVLQHAATAASSPDDPPEFAPWLEALRQPGLGQDQREEVSGPCMRISILR